MARHFLTLLACTLWVSAVYAAEELHKLSARVGTSVQALLTYDATRPVALVAILLPGGTGDYEFQEKSGAVAMKNAERLPNKMRALLLERSVASLMVDAPSDRPRIDDGFRSSSEHMVDLRAVVALAGARFPGIPVMVVGHSNGSMSAAWLAATAPELVKASVLVAPRLTWNAFRNEYIGQEGLSRFDWERITQPLLLVHHRKDGCPFTPYSGSAALAEKVKRFQLVTLDPPGPLTVGQCDYTGTHNLAGQEAAVAEAIVAWARQQTSR